MAQESWRTWAYGVADVAGPSHYRRGAFSCYILSMPILLRNRFMEKGTQRERLLSSLASLLLFTLVAALSLWAMAPPAPANRNTALDKFSAERAYDVLVRVLGDGRPHPAGSAANAAVRDRILAEFRRMGYRPEVRRRFVCSRWDTCAAVENILAVLPGSSTEPGVLLAAHYDSVAAGPGAADDGAGVAAILEVARVLRAGPTLPRSVWLLIGDGEELGLLSAEAFVLEPEFRTIGSVVNLEARGTNGPSQLFETQSGNAVIISLAAVALPYPVGSSLAYEIYKRMPNNTDFTVFRRAGLTGVNFAFTAGPARYHTPLDNLDYLDLGSLQHHGENALAMARALAAADGKPVAEQDRVFFDLFGTTLAGWPVSWNAAILVLGLIGWIALAVRSVRSGFARPLRLVAVSLLMPLLPVVAMVVAIGMQATLASTNGAAASWTAVGKTLNFAFLMLAIVCCALAARLLQRWISEAAMTLAALFTFALLAVAAVAIVPGTSFLALLPLIAGVAVGHLAVSRPTIWGGTAAICTAMLWFPFAYLSYEAVGYMALPGVTLLMAIALLPLLPAFAGLARGSYVIAGVALIGVLGLAVLSVVKPVFTEDVPRPLNLLYASSREGGRLFADVVQPDTEPGDHWADLMRAGHFGQESVESLPWSDHRRLAGRAGPAVPAPELTVLHDAPTANGRRLWLHLQSRRAARALFLILPTSAKPEVRVEQNTLELPARAGDSSWRMIRIVKPPDAGVHIEIELDTRDPMVFYVADGSDQLPLEFAAVVAARNAVAVPAHRGDRTIAWRKVQLD